MTKLRWGRTLALVCLLKAPLFAQANSDPTKQPPPLRRPVFNKPADIRAFYQDRWHHADGSTVIAAEAGGGFLVPAGHTGGSTDRGWNASAGIGWNANRHLGILLQGDYLRMPVSGSVLKSLGYPGGNVHSWSVTANPIVHYYTGHIFGAYVVGGAGYYRMVTEFTAQGSYAPCNASICFVGNSNAILASYTVNALGVSGGAGMDWKVYPPAAAKVFMEARYVWINNQRNQAIAYQRATDRMGAFPITFGLRW